MQEAENFKKMGQGEPVSDPQKHLTASKQEKKKPFKNKVKNSQILEICQHK